MSSDVLTQFRAVFLGAPGAGKGTQAAQLVGDKRVLHISTGDMLRQHIAEGSALGKKAAGYMEAGQLVPDDLIIAMVEARLADMDASQSWILDGFPRTVAQAEALSTCLDSKQSGLSHVVYFPVPQEVLVTRLSGRWTCSACGAIWNSQSKAPREEGVCDDCGGALQQRKDDRPEAVSERLKVYLAQTEPLLEHYRSQALLVEVNADRAPEAIYQELLRVLERGLG
ncbi:MAG: adenylate kinase [Planctomycetota bacterium]|jgi:adenylate kinase